MDEEYDVVVCGTGLKECILSGLLSTNGYKVLHVDRNGYYGGASASLNLTNLWQKFRPGETPPAAYGANRDWNVDLIPKFVMACGKLVKILLTTGVTRYLQWQVVEGTYVYQFQKGGFFSSERHIHKVPSGDTEALKSPLMPLLEKKRCMRFLQFAAVYDENNAETHKSFKPDSTTMRQVYDHFGLQSNTIDFVGHAMALYTSDEYLDTPMGPVMARLKLYMLSISRYGQSPFIYPVYGLGGLPEGFSRLSAVHRGTFMLNKPLASFVYGDDGKVVGVKSEEGEVAKCKLVVCDPSYVATSSGKTRKTGRIVRCICILSNPIPETDAKTSVQIIIPQKQLGRHSDVYVTMVSSAHGVAKPGKYIAMVSTIVETANPERELQEALGLLGPIEEKFMEVSDIIEPVDDGKEDQIFVTSTYDATSHFESAANDVLRIWKNITGKDIDLDTVKADPEDLQDDGC